VARPPDDARPAILERRDGVLGELVLRQAGGHYEVIANGTFLMDTRDGRSERALVREALRGMHGARLLLGGLGVGFSLAESLAGGAVSQVTVVEVEPAVIEWAGTHLRAANGGALDDPRVRLVAGDLAAELARLEGPFDAVCLDVDNGPDWTVTDGNRGLYDDSGLATIDARLTPGGVLAVWSAAASPAFAARLRTRFDDVEVLTVPVRRGEPDTVFLARQQYACTV
jgi:spermidine synthase